MVSWPVPKAPNLNLDSIIMQFPAKYMWQPVNQLLQEDLLESELTNFNQLHSDSSTSQMTDSDQLQLQSWP